MGFGIELWVEYLLRFSHLVAGIAWIGSSFYFIWLDSSFEPLKSPQKNVDGETYMVHGGFYYRVEKRKIYPGELPQTLHWFKWEATLTWVTGFLLFAVLYYLRGASLLIDPTVHALTQAQAIGLSLALITGAWLFYDLVWHPSFVTSFGRKAISTVVTLTAFSFLIYGLTQLFNGRGAFILTGVIFGSMMLLNVWVRILPGQRKMLREAQAGQVPDTSVSLKSKTRSVHNTYFIFPVLFIMLSNHYPSVYNHAQNWLLLILLAVSGALTRHAMVTKKPLERFTLFPAALGLGALVWMSAAPALPQSGLSGGERIEFSRLHSILASRCMACHSSHPTDDIYKTAPGGVLFETEEQVRAKAHNIHLHVVVAKSMPLANKTGMTDGERAVFAQWLKQEGLLPEP